MSLYSILSLSYTRKFFLGALIFTSFFKISICICNSEYNASKTQVFKILILNNNLCPENSDYANRFTNLFPLKKHPILMHFPLLRCILIRIMHSRLIHKAFKHKSQRIRESGSNLLDYTLISIRCGQRRIIKMY